MALEWSWLDLLHGKGPRYQRERHYISRLQRQSKHSQILINCPIQHTYILCACNIMIVEVCGVSLKISDEYSTIIRTATPGDGCIPQRKSAVPGAEPVILMRRDVMLSESCTHAVSMPKYVGSLMVVQSR